MRSWREPPANEGRAGVFTRYLQSLDASEELPSEGAFLAAWQALRLVLARELRRRNLREGPPSLVGIYGTSDWNEALAELLADCYSFVFVDRLDALLAQLAVKESIEGLVVLNVRHFLFERQREHDPLGYRVFEIVRSALAEAVQRGVLTVLAGDPRIKNETLLAFGTPWELEEIAPARFPEWVRAWNDELLPELITALGRGRQAVEERLRGHIESLRGLGLGPFPARDLIEPMKADIRSRWAALLERETPEAEAEPESAELAATLAALRPDWRLEQREGFRALINCVSRLLERAGGSPAARRQLAVLWGFLLTYAQGRTHFEALPSKRKLAEMLKIPRGELTGLFEQIGTLVERCQEDPRAGLERSGPVEGQAP